ncbi:DNA translocase FtsK [Cupriavidus sp. USMAA2-4]|uniref:DNA translocase FtsK n=1 Tax=Cupriavidus sp. USMAA2-4 TaxID=876364 RepID=UPI000B15AC3C|nr:DNA translocase FtsK [Cupriavidus sp. USMAA2-4]
MSHSPEMRETLNMTATTLGKDLLSALVLELKMLPDTWAKLSQKKQDDILDRLRSRVDASVKMAAHLIAANGRTVVQGDLDKITIKDGAQVLIKFGKSVSALHELAEAQGQAVLLVLSGDGSQYTGGMDEVRGESDQRGLDLGKEYTDQDGDGMPDAAAGADDNVVDAEWRPIGIEHQPLQEELDAAQKQGYEAAREGKAESDCPTMAGPLCIAWVKGWKAWHDEQSGGTEDPLYAEVEALVVESQEVSITMVQRRFKVGYNRAARLIEQLEANGVVSAMDDEGKRKVLKSTEEQEG